MAVLVVGCALMDLVGLANVCVNMVMEGLSVKFNAHWMPLSRFAHCMATAKNRMEPANVTALMRRVTGMA